MLNSERFLSQYNRIDKHLRKVLGEGRETTFGMLVNHASRRDNSVRYYADDLKELADLRNAIVHERTDEHVLAEPNDEAVKCIERIASALTVSPKVLSLFKRQVDTLDKSDSVARAVKLMVDNAFSQIPIYDKQAFTALLTTNTIAFWLGKSVGEDIFSLRETTIESVLRYSEDEDNCDFLNKNSTTFDVLERFQDYQAKGRRLEAILITNNAKRTEGLLGIITVWDLQRILEKLKK